MEKMMIGGRETTKLALGTWAIGGGPRWGDGDDRESINTIREAVDKGIELIDTARFYGYGHSEEIVGKALKGIRDKVMLATKCGLVWDGRPGSDFFNLEGVQVRKNLSGESIKRELEESLGRLGTDHVDIYITHWQSVEPYYTPVEETMETLLKLKEEGKILSIGISNATPEILEEYLKYGRVDLVQEKFSILNRAKLESFKEVCMANGIAFQAYSPLELGLLTGKFTGSYVPEKGSAREKQLWFKPDNIERVNNMLAGWRGLAEKYGVGSAQLVIAWAAAQGDFVNVLCGARKVSQLDANIEGGEISLDKDDLEKMTKDADALINVAK
jgi:methylglyoxal reductase